jgi:LPXTG-site transpeptidase (sortase) family protein
MATNTPQPDNNDVSRDNHYLLPGNGSSVSPLSPTNANEAANLIREKLVRIYADEPDPLREANEAEAATKRSKHQQFMYNLSTSGKDLATIQTEWHNYYVALSDEEKHQVWEEFYASNTATLKPSSVPVVEEAKAGTAVIAAVPEVVKIPDQAQVMSKSKNRVATNKRKRTTTPKTIKPRSIKDIQTAIREKVTAGGKLGAKQHLQSLFFGLGMGALVIIIFLFSFFNEVVIAPFIQPSRVDAATPVIVDSADITVSSTPEVIIPKINVEIPVDYDVNTTNENVIENDLEQGVVHFPTTVEPGQDGNAAFFGHSSNNILNGGKYKFAFVLLHLLVNGDTFYLTYNGKVYIYKVISKTVVSPSDVSVLNSVPGQTATATLITCDPPGTSINRLVVVGQQISPEISSNTTPAASTTLASAVTTLPSNGPSLWNRVTSSFLGKTVVSLVALAFVGLSLRWVNKMYRYGHPGAMRH